MIPAVLALVFLPYLAAVAFYHGHSKRSAIVLKEAYLRALWVIGWMLLLGSFYWTVASFGAVRGLFYQTFAVGLIMLTSQWLATRWPLLHWWSGASVLILLSIAVLY